MLIHLPRRVLDALVRCCVDPPETVSSKYRNCCLPPAPPLYQFVFQVIDIHQHGPRQLLQHINLVHKLSPIYISDRLELINANKHIQSKDMSFLAETNLWHWHFVDFVQRCGWQCAVDSINKLRLFSNSASLSITLDIKISYRVMSRWSGYILCILQLLPLVLNEI